MNAREYYLSLQENIHATVHVTGSTLEFQEIDTNECYVRGVVNLFSDFKLHVAEYVITEPVVARLKYRYHLQDSAGKQVSRWDNAPHHPEVNTFPDHRHDSKDQAVPAPPMSIPRVLEEVLPLVLSSAE